MIRSAFQQLVRRCAAMPSDKSRSTSISDNQAYPQVCLDAAMDYGRFNNFRRDPIYNEILEHVTQQQGEQYLRLIRDDPTVMAMIGQLKRNDDWGNPVVFDYGEVGRISPSTLRYIKVLVDLRRLFGSLDDLSICEIGVGYGGQCRTISASSRASMYRLVDIQPALALAQRYLENYAIRPILHFSTMNELEPQNYDLAISNYAFSELRREIQDIYLERVFLRSKRGYITYNDISPPEFASYKAEALVQILPGARVFNEEPLTHPRNCIIAWGAFPGKSDS